MGFAHPMNMGDLQIISVGLFPLWDGHKIGGQKKTRIVADAGESTLEENLREASVYLPVWEPPIPYSWDIDHTKLFFC